MICRKNIIDQIYNWKVARPFPHLVIDNFFDPEVAYELDQEFPLFGDDVWHQYDNPLEIKKTCNNWNLFPPKTYRAFAYLNSDNFCNFLSEILFEGMNLMSDPGLHGGGWHIHGRGGKLNCHLDYAMHPKQLLQRKLNIIIYLNREWDPQWGGNLGLWGNDSADAPGKLLKEIVPKYNRAVIFDTTCNSWHGLSSALDCPVDQFRKSLAVYYLAEPPVNADTRGKALFAPSADQVGDQSVLELIRARSDVRDAASVYKNDS